MWALGLFRLGRQKEEEGTGDVSMASFKFTCHMLTSFGATLVQPIRSSLSQTTCETMRE